ncbi:PREDICTED: melanoma inhibitory activity protein 3 [Calidris pugnax]|nr:PREDICTED: melanoma inhibitory activity protein 3 [Calidris pugnax]
MRGGRRLRPGEDGGGPAMREAGLEGGLKHGSKWKLKLQKKKRSFSAENLNLPPPPSLLCAAAGTDLGRRFAERKRCADPECSMLMCRGKARQDFKGPDCRFVNFKKGEAVYVYYKLIGKSTELWAGSVGSDFGYFPKDLLEINHNYSSEELELPTDETDFVCFDGGRDDFDNYNVDELLKSLQETIANEGETESSDPGTKRAEGIERDVEIEKVNTVKSLDALETDSLELSTAEDKEDLATTEEVDSSVTEGTENTGGDPSIYSHKENSQGDQIAHEHLKGTLHGKLQGLESENTKNTSIPQGETSQLDTENEEVNAYTLLNRELSVNLKTKFGSTADAVVSDDEVTRLVTSLEDDFNEDLSIDAHDAEEEPDFADQSEEIPLLSFTAGEEIASPADLEDDENDDIESQNHEPDEDAKGATELNNQRDNEEELDSDALILKDAFSKSKKLGDSVSVDRSEPKQTREKQDEVMLISKREAPASTQPEDLAKELLRKEPVGTGDHGSKEKTNKTEQFEEQLTVGGTEPHTEELKSTAVPDPHVLPSPGDDLESKSLVKSKQDALKPPIGDSNRSPEKVPLAQIEKDEKKFEDDILEEVLESDLKNKKQWEKTKEEVRAENKPSVDVPTKPAEEVKNASQTDLGDTDILKEKVEHGMPAVEKELRRHEEDFKQAGDTNHENQKNTSFNKEPEIKGKNMEETPAGKSDPSRRGAVEQPRPRENETEYSEADVKEELSRNLGKMTVFEESIKKSSPEEKSKSIAQNTNTENLTQQGTARTEAADSDGNLGTNVAKERTPRPELQSEEPDDQDNRDLKQVEEELLEDENAASAKLSQAKAANVQGDTLHVKSTNPGLEVPSEAVSATANPTYKTGEETNWFSKEAGRPVSMQDASKTGNKEVDVPVSEDAKSDELERVMEEDDEESSEAEKPAVEEEPAVEEHNFQPPDTEDDNDFNQRKDHVPEGVSEKDSKELQNLEHTRYDHQQPAHLPSPADSSEATNDTVTDFSESVKRLTIIRDFLDEKRVIRLQKYLGLEHVVRIEAMFHDMKVEMELAQKASHNNEDIEKALDQILEFSESSIMDAVGKVLDSRVAENKEEVVKEMDLYDEESALMDDIQELIYSLRSKYSSASESVPLASVPEQEDDELHIQDGVKEAEYDGVSMRNPNAFDESNQKSQQLEEERPEQPVEKEEERAANTPPEHEEANLSDNREAEEGYDSGKGSLLEDTSFGSIDSGQNAREDVAPEAAAAGGGGRLPGSRGPSGPAAAAAGEWRRWRRRRGAMTQAGARGVAWRGEGRGCHCGLTCAWKLARAAMDPAGVGARLAQPPARRLLQVREAEGRGEREGGAGARRGFAPLLSPRGFLLAPPPYPAMWGSPVEAAAAVSTGLDTGRHGCPASCRPPRRGGLRKGQLAPRLGFAGGSVCPRFNLTLPPAGAGEKAAVSGWFLQFIFQAPCLYRPCELYQLVAMLPEEIRPGPDFHGLPWEPIIITALVGIATLAIFFWRTCLSVKSRIYQVTEKQLAEKIKNLLQEKTEILEKISEYDQKIKEAKESVKVAQEQKDILSDETAGLKDTLKELEEENRQLDDKVKNLHTMLETERKKNEKKQNKISETQKSLEKLQEAISVHSVELSEVQIALNEAKLSEEKVKSELHHVQEENARLKKSKEQLLKEAEGWSERHSELSEQIKLYQKSQKDIEEALAYKENEIEVLTNCIMQLKQLDMDSVSEAKKDGEGREWGTGEELANGEVPDNESEKMKAQIKQMMDVSRVKTMLSIVEEDRNLLQSKLSDEVTARHELEEQIKKLEHDSCSLQSAKAQLENECKTLQQKVEILGELYQQKEMALQKKLTQEEYERQEKEQKLSAADEKAVLAIEEVKVYKQRIQDMEEELLKTERSYKNQIAAHEKKAHDNWLIARSAERALAEEKREAANLRQKLIEVNQKIVMLQRPLIVKPTPGRPDRQVPPRRGPLSRDGSFGPSPVSGGNPSPTQMIEVPARPLSAPRREGPRGEFGTVVDGPPAPRRPPELPGRMSVPDLGPAVASLIGGGPRTSSPSAAMDGVQPSPKESEAPCVTTDSPSPVEPATGNAGPKGPPSFPGTPIMTSPAMGPPPPPPVRYGPPPAPLRGHFGPRPLPVPLVRGAPLPPPAPRDFLPGPPLGMRDLPPGPMPPPDPRGYGRGHPPFPPLGPPGPRDYPPGPRLPPPGSRDYTPSPNRDLPPAGPRDHPAGPPPPPKDYTQPPAQKP